MFTIGERGQEYMSYNTATCTVSANSATSTATAHPNFGFTGVFHPSELITADRMNSVHASVHATVKPKPDHWVCQYCHNANPDEHNVCGENKFWGCGAPREK